VPFLQETPIKNEKVREYYFIDENLVRRKTIKVILQAIRAFHKRLRVRIRSLIEPAHCSRRVSNRLCI